MNDNPMVALSHAIALAMAQGPAAGLERLDALANDSRLAGQHRLDCVSADYFFRISKKSIGGQRGMGCLPPLGPCRWMFIDGQRGIGCLVPLGPLGPRSWVFIGGQRGIGTAMVRILDCREVLPRGFAKGNYRRGEGPNDSFKMKREWLRGDGASLAA